MPTVSFVHLGARSEFSTGTSLARIEDLCREAARHGQGALALTDVDTLAGAVRFQQAAHRAGIRPILGVELSIRAAAPAPTARVRLLAENTVGWRRLLALLPQVRTPETGEVRGIPMELLLQQPRGLFLLIGGLHGELTRLLLARDFEGAEAHVERLRSVWPADRLFVELPDPVAGGTELVRLLAKAADYFGLPAVAVPRIDAAVPQDDVAARYLEAARDGRLPATIADLAVPVADRRHLADAETVFARYAPYPTALENAARIAAACDVAIHPAERRFPVFDYTRGVDAESFLWNEAFERASMRYGDLPTAYKERLNREFRDITEAGLQHALVALVKLDEELAARGVRRGPGAGVFTHSLIASLLGVSGLDPSLFDLTFRVPESIATAFPPIECTVATTEDSAALEALRAVFGGQVAAVGRWQPWRLQAAVEHVTTSLGMSPRDRAALWRDVGFQGILEASVTAPPPLEAESRSPEAIAWVATRLDGLARRLSAAPGLYVFTVEALTLSLPLRPPGEDQLPVAITEWTEEQLATLRFGLAALSNPPLVDLVAMARREGPSPAPVPDDPATLRLLREGRTSGIEPLEAPSIRRELRRLGAEDLVGFAQLAATPAGRGAGIDLPTILLAYEAAWLKVHRPPAFFAAALSGAGADTRRLAALMAEVHELGIPVLALDVNCSARDWTVEGRGIRPGLMAIRDLSVAAVAELLHVRRELAFSDLADLLRRTDPARLRPRHLQALIRSGALDSLGPSRAAHLAALGRLLPLLRPTRSRSGQEDLFASIENTGDFFQEAVASGDSARAAAELLDAERTATGGVLLRVGPIEDRFIAEIRAVPPRELSPRIAGRRICLAGPVHAIETDPEAPGTLLLEVDGCLVRVREAEYRVVHGAAQSGRPCLFTGTACRAGRHWEFTAESVATLDTARTVAQQAKVLTINPSLVGEALMPALLTLVKRFPGPTPLRLTGPGGAAARQVEARRVVVCPLLEAELRTLLPPGSWKVEATAGDGVVQPMSSGASRLVRRMFETFGARR